MAAQWPRVTARLVALLPTLPGWAQIKVYDGAALDSQTASFCTVAHASDGITAHVGNYTVTTADDGFRRIEQGTVACSLTSTADLGALAPSRLAVFALIDALDDAIRADRTLGVLSREGTTDLTVDVASMQVVGNAQVLTFNVDYYTVT